MDIETGHLIDISGDGYVPEGYEKVPQELVKFAKQELDGEKEVYVDLRKRTPLAKWAKQKRKERRKMAKRSRKINRGKK